MIEEEQAPDWPNEVVVFLAKAKERRGGVGTVGETREKEREGRAEVSFGRLNPVSAFTPLFTHSSTRLFSKLHDGLFIPSVKAERFAKVRTYI